ncbi:antitoxin Xre/MbcA/ParS toxin-binding domain-containing protein [Roseateles sp.]|uniref:antitoxin Xre/MbcA/ParS toxin-binding domain-containing protein n=1 Tax=Roseateles sp. TaxID=1971397 RepID=UPI003263AE38
MIDHTPSGHGFVSLLEAFRDSGGTAPSDIVGRLLLDHQAGAAVSLAKLIHSGQVFGFEWRASLWIPMFQFDPKDLSIAAQPQAVRAQLPELWSGWRVAQWFAGPNSRLGGQRPVDLLSSDAAAVLVAAQGLPLPRTQAHVANVALA